MANVLNVTYNVFNPNADDMIKLNETELDTATFIDENDLSDLSEHEETRRNTSQSILKFNNCSPISLQLTAADSSYFVKNNLTEADHELDSISALQYEQEIEIQPVAAQPQQQFKRQNSVRKCYNKVYNKVLKPIVHKLSSKRSTTISNTSEELSSISGLHYTTNTPSISQLTFDDENSTLTNYHFNKEYEYLERFQKVRLSSTKYESVAVVAAGAAKVPTATINRFNKPIIIDNDEVLRNFQNYGDFVIWHV